MSCQKCGKPTASRFALERVQAGHGMPHGGPVSDVCWVGLYADAHDAPPASSRDVAALRAELEAAKARNVATVTDTQAEIDELRAYLEAAEAKLAEAMTALQKISDIRDSLIGGQQFNWSEHAYPLVAVLAEAGFKGKGYEVSRANLGTLIEQAKEARQECALAKCDVVVLSECLATMINYLGHTDQDADHGWMVQKMRKARQASTTGRDLTRAENAAVESDLAKMFKPVPTYAEGYAAGQRDAAEALETECEISKDRAWSHEFSCPQHGTWFRHSGSPDVCPVGEFAANLICVLSAKKDGGT